LKDGIEMTERKYTLSELDRMRWAIYRRNCPKGPGAYTPPSDAMIEDQLRTLMYNGTDPEELEAEMGGPPRMPPPKTVV